MRRCIENAFFLFFFWFSEIIENETRKIVSVGTMTMIIVFVEFLAINHKQCCHMLEQIHCHAYRCIHQIREMFDQLMGTVEIASIRTDGVHVIGECEFDFFSQRNYWHFPFINRFIDHKRDRFDNSYNRTSHGYHRDRDHRDRDRDRRIDKRRLVSFCHNELIMQCVQLTIFLFEYFSRYAAPMGYPSSHPHYLQPGYYDGAMTSGGSEYRGRYSSDWNRERDRDYADYRREYGRPPPPPSSSGTS